MVVNMIPAVGYTVICIFWYQLFLRYGVFKEDFQLPWPTKGCFAGLNAEQLPHHARLIPLANARENIGTLSYQRCPEAVS